MRERGNLAASAQGRQLLYLGKPQDRTGSGTATRALRVRSCCSLWNPSTALLTILMAVQNSWEPIARIACSR
ncbi:hypothetical protein [Scytonema sp. NUACC21]